MQFNYLQKKFTCLGKAGNDFKDWIIYAYSPKTGSSWSFGNNVFCLCTVLYILLSFQVLFARHMYVFIMLMMQLKFLEEKHCLSSKHSSSSCSFPACESSEPAQDHESYKTLSSAIEEVNRKGTLMERVAVLENRVLQVIKLSIKQQAI